MQLMSARRACLLTCWFWPGPLQAQGPTPAQSHSPDRGLDLCSGKLSGLQGNRAGVSAQFNQLCGSFT